MAAILWSDVQAMPGVAGSKMAAKVAAVDPVWQTIMLALANTYLDVNVFAGEDSPATKTARCLYVMHLLALEFMASASAAVGATGPVTKDQAGKLLREYGSIDRLGGGMGQDPLSLTVYGRALLTLAWPTTRARVL